MKLKTYEKAEKVIMEALKDQSHDLNSLISQAKFTGLLAKVHERSGNIDLAIRSLTEAKEIRAKSLKRIQVEQPDAVHEHKQLTANICHQMAEHAVVLARQSIREHHKKRPTFEQIHILPDPF